MKTAEAIALEVAKRRETIDESDPLFGHTKSTRMDLGIAILSAVAIFGVRYTQDEIAAFAGCHRQAIQNVETKALKKLRNQLFSRKGPVLIELVESILGRTPVTR